MKAIFDERQLLHDPERYFRRGAYIPHPEQPERAVLIRDMLGAQRLPDRTAARFWPRHREAGA